MTFRRKVILALSYNFRSTYLTFDVSVKSQADLRNNHETLRRFAFPFCAHVDGDRH
jgi:hypothetical protein